MKKLLLLVSCFAVVLILCKVSFAQEEVVTDPAASCPYHVVPSLTVPFAQPGLNVSLHPRDVRRAVRLDARLTAKQTRLEARLNPPPFVPYPFPAVESTDPTAFVPGGPIAQNGRRNTSIQRSGGAPVINFLSVVRGPRAGYDPYATYPQPVSPQ